MPSTPPFLWPHELNRQLGGDPRHPNGHQPVGPIAQAIYCALVRHADWATGILTRSDEAARDHYISAGVSRRAYFDALANLERAGVLTRARTTMRIHHPDQAAPVIDPTHPSQMSDSASSGAPDALEQRPSVTPQVHHAHSPGAPDAPEQDRFGMPTVHHAHSLSAPDALSQCTTCTTPSHSPYKESNPLPLTSSTIPDARQSAREPEPEEEEEVSDSDSVHESIPDPPGIGLPALPPSPPPSTPPADHEAPQTPSVPPSKTIPRHYRERLAAHFPDDPELDTKSAVNPSILAAIDRAPDTLGTTTAGLCQAITDAAATYSERQRRAQFFPSLKTLFLAPPGSPPHLRDWLRRSAGALASPAASPNTKEPQMPRDPVAIRAWSAIREHLATAIDDLDNEFLEWIHATELYVDPNSGERHLNLACGSLINLQRFTRLRGNFHGAFQAALTAHAINEINPRT